MSTQSMMYRQYTQSEFTRAILSPPYILEWINEYLVYVSRRIEIVNGGTPRINSFTVAVVNTEKKDMIQREVFVGMSDGSNILTQLSTSDGEVKWEDWYKKWPHGNFKIYVSFAKS